MEFQASNPLTLTYYLVVLIRFCKWKFYHEELHHGYSIYGQRWNKQYFYTQRNGWATGNDFVTLTFFKLYLYATSIFFFFFFFACEKDSGAFLERRRTGLTTVTIQGDNNEFYNLTNYEWGYKVSTFILINLPTLLLYVKFRYSTLSTINIIRFLNSNI